MAAQAVADLLGCSGNGGIVVVASSVSLPSATYDLASGTNIDNVKCCPLTCCPIGTTTDICCSSGSKQATAAVVTGHDTQVDLDTPGTPNGAFPFESCYLGTCNTAVVPGGAPVTTTGTSGPQTVASLNCCDDLKNSCCPVGSTSSCCSAGILYINMFTTVTSPNVDYTMINAVPIPPSPASQCAIPAPSPPADPEPVLAPTTNTDTVIPAALATVLAALAFLILFVGLPGFGAAGLGRKKRSLKRESDINSQLDEATFIIKRLINAAQESYGTNTGCSDASVAN